MGLSRVGKGRHYPLDILAGHRRLPPWFFRRGLLLRSLSRRPQDHHGDLHCADLLQLHHLPLRPSRSQSQPLRQVRLLGTLHATFLRDLLSGKRRVGGEADFDWELRRERKRDLHEELLSCRKEKHGTIRRRMSDRDGRGGALRLRRKERCEGKFCCCCRRCRLGEKTRGY